MFTHTPTNGRSHVVQRIMGNYFAWGTDATGQKRREKEREERNLFSLPVLCESLLAQIPSFMLANSLMGTTVDIQTLITKINQVT